MRAPPFRVNMTDEFMSCTLISVFELVELKVKKKHVNFPFPEFIKAFYKWLSCGIFLPNKAR